tara:strand:- start:127 stop:240 length:114 start_codon:yes stop_codon:yes gene_type:complete
MDDAADDEKFPDKQWGFEKIKNGILVWGVLSEIFMGI